MAFSLLVVPHVSPYLLNLMTVKIENNETAMATWDK